MSFHGIIPPLATPFKDNEDLDIERLKWFIEQQIEAGVHGIFVLGTNSEFYAMDEAEKQQVIAVAVAQVRKRVPVFAGTGAETTREAERLTKMAQKEGVDGVSVITPYFIMPNQNEIHDHYKRIAESTNLPVLLYSNPVTCGGLKIDPDTCGRLAKIKNIVGIKDSSGDLQTTIEILRAVPSDFVVMQGRDTLIFSALQMGAKGAVPATCNIAPKLLVEIYEKFKKGDIEGSKAAQAKLHPLRMALTLGTAPGGVKSALRELGRSIGPCRSPVALVGPDKIPKLKEALAAAGLV
ncbi:MAG: 4-hydroxy-tetrahydrodipicolinate synthase [Planctomycetes bacterium]|nr:4-hydroxy-tetrahydrodipicolinate synthase [Planctomycetota bacterium]